jgi:hypothetical protein
MGQTSKTPIFIPLASRKTKGSGTNRQTQKHEMLLAFMANTNKKPAKPIRSPLAWVRSIIAMVW